MYKSAKKKFNDRAIQEAIDIAKLNVSRRKLRVNGFGKKFIAVIKVIKVEKTNEKPNEVEKKSTNLKSKSSFSTMKEKVVAKTTKVTKHFSSMNFTSNPLFNKRGKSKVELVNPFSKGKENVNDDDVKTDVKSVVKTDAKSGDSEANLDGSSVQKRPKGNWVLLSELPRDVYVKKGMVTDIPIVFKSSYKAGDEIYVEIPSTKNDSDLYAAMVIVPDGATNGDTLHLVMTLNDEGVPIATGRSVEHLSDALNKELTGANITEKSKSDRESSPNIDSVEGVKVCAM